MSKSNRLASNERKIAHLLGEQKDLEFKVEKIEAFIENLPRLRERIAEIDNLLLCLETVIKDDRPEWTGDHLKPRAPRSHQIPIRLGNGSRLALQIVREAHMPLTVREIAEEALRREGHDEVDPETMERVCRTIGAGLNSHRRRGTDDRLICPSVAIGAFAW